MKTRLRLGIIGAGAVVREIYQYLYFQSRHSPLLEVRAVADPNDEYRNWFGDLAKIPPDRRFADYKEMLARVELDAVQVNTPDHLHCAPTLAALAAGLDVVVAKPAAATVRDAHAMIQAAKRAGRFLGVDFHKRDDPRLREAAARFRRGRYGTFQTGVFYMIDQLRVADPNHAPRFFASPDFAERNTPISFLTVHLADVLLQLVGLVPAQVTARGYSQKLPSLKPRAVNGYDLVDTEIVFHTGAAAHLVTGWALPNTAWSTTVQSARLIGSEGLLDLGLDTPGLREVHADGLAEINPLFRNFDPDGRVSGYGVDHPGGLYRQILAWRNGALTAEESEAIETARTRDFYTTAVLEGAEQSLARGRKLATGATLGATIDLEQLVKEQIGETAAADYQQKSSSK